MELGSTKEEDPLLPIVSFSDDEAVDDGDGEEIDYHCIKNRIVSLLSLLSVLYAIF